MCGMKDTHSNDDIFICLDNPIQDDCRTGRVAIPNNILPLVSVCPWVVENHFLNMTWSGNGNRIAGIEARCETPAKAVIQKLDTPVVFCRGEGFTILGHSEGIYSVAGTYKIFIGNLLRRDDRCVVVRRGVLLVWNLFFFHLERERLKQRCAA